MKLRGALIPCGPGMRGAAWPDTPKVRLSAIASLLDGGHVAAFLTAAWVWNAAPDPGHPISVAAHAGCARRPVAPNVRRYELRLAPGDTVLLGAFHATSPKRTLLDLLHHPYTFGDEEREACRGLLGLLPEGAEQCAHEVEHTRRPYAKLARIRLRELLPHSTPTLP